uniref:Uncharacterized protein n=1 Tax=Candidatus Berkiella aquae TaxID=295108 RepID=A0A0Q9YLD9_9GAMM
MYTDGPSRSATTSCSLGFKSQCTKVPRITPEFCSCLVDHPSHDCREKLLILYRLGLALIFIFSLSGRCHLSLKIVTFMLWGTLSCTFSKVYMSLQHIFCHPVGKQDHWQSHSHGFLLVGFCGGVLFCSVLFGSLFSRNGLNRLGLISGSLILSPFLGSRSGLLVLLSEFFIIFDLLINTINYSL